MVSKIIVFSKECTVGLIVMLTCFPIQMKFKPETISITQHHISNEIENMWFLKNVIFLKLYLVNNLNGIVFSFFCSILHLFDHGKYQTTLDNCTYLTQILPKNSQINRRKWNLDFQFPAMLIGLALRTNS